MYNSKYHQYKNISKESGFVYSGTLAVVTNDDINYNVYSPVNTISNSEELQDVIVSEDTLSNQGD